MRNQARAAASPGARQAAMERYFVPVHNFFFDTVMPRVSGNQFKVLLFVWRKTVGFDRWEDWISLSQIEQGTGLCRDTVLDALDFWEGTGLVRRLGRRGIRGVIAYASAIRYEEAAVLARLPAVVERTDRSKESALTGRNLPTSPVEETDTQRETNEEKGEKEGAVHQPPREERVLQGQREKEVIYRRQRLAKLGRRA